MDQSLLKNNSREWSMAVDAWAKHGPTIGERKTHAISYWSVRTKAHWMKKKIGEVWQVGVTDGDTEIRNGRLRIPMDMTLLLQRVDEYHVVMLCWPS